MTGSSKLSRIVIMAASAGILTAAACLDSSERPARRTAAQPLFEVLDPTRTGVTFTNTLPEDTTFNILNYLYYYNGGGVAVGDVNNDGLPDLYFTSNLGANRLYLNKGNYQFEDVTERAGVADSVGWKTGVTMADVNGDGLVDIYVSGVDYLGVHGRNVLYINNGDGTFTDRTKEYGLDFSGYSTQALFFDYDNDGALDMYLLNHSVHTEHGAGTAASRTQRHPRAGDRLYHNEHGHFVDVSAAAGIYGGVFGYGLGVVASDFEKHGCMDIYVANDFQEDDFLYRNNCDGTFTEIGAAALRHTSRSSMGVDAADFNNDGRPDIVTADMLPDRQDVLRSSATAESFALYNLKLQAGYHPQFARNALQLNRGVTDGAPRWSAGPPPAGERTAHTAGVPRFSDIGYLAGVAATDWSWAPLFADFDNDGRKDLFITSGIYRRPNDLDYLTYVNNPAIQASLQRGITRENLTLVQRMPHVPLPNHAFRNNGDLTFTNVTDAWGLGQLGFSNGAAYVDLNNSGALDLVINRVNAPAAIYRNRAREVNHHHFLRIQLRGSGGNTAGIGARVTIWQGATMQLLEQMPTRGFQSSVDPRLHFGLGDAPSIDSLLVVWPGGAYQKLTNVAADRTLTLEQSKAAGRYDYGVVERASNPEATAPPPLFSDVTARVGLDWRHREREAFDFNREPLLPHLLSRQGPAIAVADVNGDGLEDLYVGGARGQPGTLFLQQRDGTFRVTPQQAFVDDSLFDDVDALFFDANGDGHPDLYVVSGSGGGVLTGSDDLLQDRLYVNDGHGHLRRDRNALPRMAEAGSRVVAGDFNGNGRVDLFVARRAVAGSYGAAPRGYLLENDGSGHFRDVTSERAPALVDAGMITSAAWVDYDHDGKLDLIVVGEWMPVRVFHQEGGRLVDRTREAGLAGSNGWWNDVTVADVDGDGRPDLVLGNLGLNSYLTASRQEPARLYLGDFAHDHTVQPILTVYKHGVSVPVATRDELIRAVPELRSRFPTYASFGASRLEDLFPQPELRGARVLEAYDFATSVALNNGNGTFTLRPLPIEAQFSPVTTSLAGDYDGDGRVDLLLAGNDYGIPPLVGRYDASYGLLLRGTGTGGDRGASGAAASARGRGLFEAVDLSRSGLVLDGQVRHLRALRQAGGSQLIVVARNDDKLQVLRVTTPTHKGP